MKASIFKSDFIKNVGKLMLGTVLAQLIPIGLQPILRRMYSPEEFGAYAIYLSIIAMFSATILFRYDQAIVPAKKNEDANQLLKVSLVICFLFCTLLFVFAFFFKEEISRFLKLPKKNAYILYFAIVGLFLAGSYKGINMWLIRMKLFSVSSINKVVRRGAEGATQLSFANVLKSISLPLGDIIGNIFTLLFGLFSIFKRHKFTIGVIKITPLIKTAIKYKKYPIENLIPTLFNSISLVLPVFLINKFYDQQTTGYLDLSRQVLAIPLALIAVSLSQSMLQKNSELINARKSILPLIKNTFILLVSLSIVGVLAFNFIGIELFEIIFGSEWHQSGIFSTILVYSYAIKFIVSPLSVNLLALQKLKPIAIWQTIYFLLICSMYFFKNLDIFDFLKVYVCIDILAYISYGIIIYFGVKTYENTINKNA